MKEDRQSSRHHSLRYLYLPNVNSEHFRSGQKLPIDSKKIKHLVHVLRLNEGDQVRVTDGKGSVFLGTLETQKESSFVLLNELHKKEDAPIPLHLVIGLPKNPTMDFVIEKATECGATQITPLVSARSVVRPKEGQKYLQRWNVICEGALEQCERSWAPKINAPIDWKMLKELSKTPLVKKFAFLSEMRNSTSDGFIDSLKKLNNCYQKPTALVIGPEGGFDKREQQELVGFGFEAITLGSTVLRVETAAIAALTLVRAAQLAGCFVGEGHR